MAQGCTWWSHPATTVPLKVRTQLGDGAGKQEGMQVYRYAELCWEHSPPFSSPPKWGRNQNRDQLWATQLVPAASGEPWGTALGNPAAAWTERNSITAESQTAMCSCAWQHRDMRSSWSRRVPLCPHQPHCRAVQELNLRDKQPAAPQPKIFTDDPSASQNRHFVSSKP